MSSGDLPYYDTIGIEKGKRIRTAQRETYISNYFINVHKENIICCYPSIKLSLASSIMIPSSPLVKLVSLISIIVINPICFYINFIIIFNANYINTVNLAFVYRCNLNQDTYFARDLFDRNRYRAVSKSTYIFLCYNSRIFIFNLNLYICLC